MKRVFLIVLDSCGAGALPDAADFGDAHAHTLRSCFNTGILNVPTLCSLGLGHIQGLDFLPHEKHPLTAYGRMIEQSRGKDTTLGHWELAGCITDHPLPTYPNGFPPEVLQPFSQQTSRGVLCNRPYSGTEVIKDYGRQHLETGDLIVYTSADSVFQIAAHESIVPPDLLYTYCRQARAILQGKHGVGRVIARPFTGQWPFTRTGNRRDFSLEPPKNNLLNRLVKAGLDSIAIGKINDIFAGQGITQCLLTHSNAEGMAAASDCLSQDFHGLCFINLVDFDMLYGHRNNAAGYAEALNDFDLWLNSQLPRLGNEDCLIITADHGCDPGDISTDHTREYVPLLCYGPAIKPTALGTRHTFGDVAASIANIFYLPSSDYGTPFIS